MSNTVKPSPRGTSAILSDDRAATRNVCVKASAILFLCTPRLTEHVLGEVVAGPQDVTLPLLSLPKEDETTAWRVKRKQERKRRSPFLQQALALAGVLPGHCDRISDGGRNAKTPCKRRLMNVKGPQVVKVTRQPYSTARLIGHRPEPL